MLVVVKSFFIASIFLSAFEAKQPDIDYDIIDEVFGTAKPTISDDEEPTPKPPDAECTCVPWYLCENNTVITDGKGLIDIRLRNCANYMEVCCGEGKIQKEPIVTTPKPIPSEKIVCGKRNVDGAGFRITGAKDNETEFGEFPWMVAIIRESDNPDKPGVYQCGGALIHPKVVLTAAHCIKNQFKYYIRAGEWDTQTTKEILPHQDREVEGKVIHSQYYSGALFNDIALLFLKTPVAIAENVNVICLPPKDLVVDSSRCITTGWGKDLFGNDGKYQVIMKKIDLPIVPSKTCQNYLRKTRLGNAFELHRSFICAGGEAGKDACKGDGGSPLICPYEGEDEMYYQAGIVAWGIGCGSYQVPGVYVNVALFRDWIDEQMSNNELDTKYYQH